MRRGFRQQEGDSEALWAQLALTKYQLWEFCAANLHKTSGIECCHGLKRGARPVPPSRLPTLLQVGRPMVFFLLDGSAVHDRVPVGVE